MDDAAAEAWQRVLEGHMPLYWKKWTSGYDKPPEVREAEGKWIGAREADDPCRLAR
jgi:hypothetical protein